MREAAKETATDAGTEMKGHLFIHIGPPKTATTSLQIGLTELETPGFAFLGVFQPRDPERNWIARSLHNYASFENPEEEDRSEAAIREIETLLKAGNAVVISEERFLVWREEASFWEKIERLDKVLGEIPRTYLVTMRNPKDALPSYYQEIFASLPLSQKNSQDLFFNHERCDCYDYSKIVRRIGRLGRQVRLVDFELVTRGRFNLSDRLGDEADIDAEVFVPQANIGEKAAATEIRNLPAITLVDLVRKGPLRPAVKMAKRFLPGGINGLKFTAGRGSLRKQGLHEKLVPEKRLQELQTSYHAAKLAGGFGASSSGRPQ